MGQTSTGGRRVLNGKGWGGREGRQLIEESRPGLIDDEGAASE